MKWSRQFQTALYSLNGIGPAAFRRCLKTLTECEASEADFWADKGQLWGKMMLNKKIEYSIKNFIKEYNSDSYFESLSAKGIRVVFPADEEFPPLLKEIDNAPPLLFARGGRLVVGEIGIAAVGTRKITAYGRRVIAELIPPLVAAGIPVISGFMYGADVAAQQAALDAGGKTVGVLGFGFDSFYPPEQRPLFERFLEAGALFFSPFAPHVPARPGNFPARNAVVAGMSRGVLVIEGARKSGSLITAHAAAEFGREVWAVPGSIFSEFSEGTQQLINEGAQLVRSAADILGAGTARHSRQPVWKSLPVGQQRICEALSEGSLTADELAQRLLLPAAELSVRLVELELSCLVEQSGNRWELRP